MQLSRFLFRVALLLCPIALIGTTWLYLYPIFHGCAFPKPPSTEAQAIAPFRLLSLGDPQLEGDSSLPDPNALIFPSIEKLVPDLRDAANSTQRRDIVEQAARGVVKDVGRWLEGKRKAIDLWGNDWYLSHIVRSLRWWTEPTHISVLGDLLGSQWVTDGEFTKRAGRYWNIVMRGLEKVPDAIFGALEPGKKEQPPTEPTTEQDVSGEEAIDEEPKPERKALWGGTTEVLGADQNWEKRVINIVGNHDVGYAGDIDESRIERFEKAFGSSNWDIWFTLPDTLRLNKTTESSTPDLPRPPTLRLIILNSMNLDTPAWSSDLQTETYSYMNHIITSSLPVNDKTHSTILLTHIPLEKEEGVCVDSPYFDFFEGGQGVKEQNMLSGHASKIVLEGLFGMSANKDAEGKGQGRRGIILNGHDHAGCDVVHYIRQPGVDDACQVAHVKREEAYWPASTTNDTMIATSMDIDGVDINVVAANDTIAESDPTPEPTPEPEPPAPPKWKARRFPPRPYDITPANECTSINDVPHIREITLRSMMGEYSGYAGFLSAWFDESKGGKGEWVFEFSTCGVGVQHWWWGVHIVDLVLLLCFLFGILASVYERVAVDTRYPAITKDRKKPESESTKTSTEGETVVHTTRERTSSVTEVTKRRIWISI
ncbi:hypothetical protein BKA58DRAFT_303973 [Alternaria rosae]|uniref:uncharacterized protein n=1 Tax=Alternaria rosae TaxID=1187941 RepID=UPI001E8E1D7E|nr:uncharacterized protein BKA58DRAFT_303973 [Alternaria rosae]KAH6882489.1 hypothetical protein BKA58DRAFT_303973 [Alternaria rosae]